MNLPFFNKPIIPILFVLFLIFPGCQSDQTTGGGGSSAGGTPTDQIVIIVPNSPPLSNVYPVSVRLPMPLFQSTSVIYSDSVAGSFLFVLGGAYFDVASPTPNDPINVATVYWTKIKSDGTILPFCSAQNIGSCQPFALPNNIRGHTSVLNGNDIYVIGGIQSGVGFSDAIYKSTITIHPPDTTSSTYYPTLSQWLQVGILPVAETGMASVTVGSNLFVIGGIESGLPDFSTCILTGFCQGSQNTVYSKKIYGYSLPLSQISSYAVTSHSTYTIPLSHGIFTPAATIDNNSNLWVLGGWGPDPNISGNPPNNLNQIYKFNAFAIDQSVLPMPIMPNGVGLSKAAAFYTTTSGTGQIILIGGISGIQGTPDIIHREIYSTTPSSLTPTNTTAWTPIGQIPQAITCFASALDPASGRIYVI